jgi:hypothetical protein
MTELEQQQLVQLRSELGLPLYADEEIYASLSPYAVVVRGIGGLDQLQTGAAIGGALVLRSCAGSQSIANAAEDSALFAGRVRLGTIRVVGGRAIGRLLFCE